MATIVPLTYRCRLEETESALPVFVDLGAVRSGPLLERVALGRVLTVPRLIESPIRLMVNDAGDLADPLEQQVVAGLLASSGSQLVLAGVPVRPDITVLALREELQQIAGARAWFVPAEPDEDDPRRDVREVIQALVVGLEILPSQVAALLNAIPEWAKRGPARGFNRQSVNHFVSRTAGPPVPYRLSESPFTGDLGKMHDVAAVALTAGGYLGVLGTLAITVPADGARPHRRAEGDPEQDRRTLRWPAAGGARPCDPRRATTDPGSNAGLRVGRRSGTVPQPSPPGEEPCCCPPQGPRPGRGRQQRPLHRVGPECGRIPHRQHHRHLEHQHRHQPAGIGHCPCEAYRCRWLAVSGPSPMPPAAGALRHRQAVVDGSCHTGTGPEPDPRYTAHALHRMASLGFTRDDVRDTIDNPLWTRPNGRAHAQDRRVVVGTTLLVVWHPATNTVVTVMLRTAEPYHHGQHDRQNLPAAA